MEVSLEIRADVLKSRTVKNPADPSQMMTIARCPCCGSRSRVWPFSAVCGLSLPFASLSTPRLYIAAGFGPRGAARGRGLQGRGCGGSCGDGGLWGLRVPLLSTCSHAGWGDVSRVSLSFALAWGSVQGCELPAAQPGRLGMSEVPRVDLGLFPQPNPGVPLGWVPGREGESERRTVQL